MKFLQGSYDPKDQYIWLSICKTDNY